MAGFLHTLVGIVFTNLFPDSFSELGSYASSVTELQQ